jgi:hypothetical protein
MMSKQPPKPKDRHAADRQINSFHVCAEPLQVRQGDEGTLALQLVSPLLLDLNYLRHEVADLVAIEFCDRSNAVDILDEVFRCTQKRLERRLGVTATEQVAVRRDDQFDQSGRGSIFAKQTSKNRLKMDADLHGPELLGAVPANLIGFTNRVVWIQSTPGQSSRY